MIKPDPEAVRTGASERTVNALSKSNILPLTASLLASTTAPEVVKVVVDRAIALLGARAGLVAVVSEDGQALEVVRTSGYSDATMRGWERLPLSANLPLSDAARENKILWFEGKADWQARYPEMMSRVTDGNFQAATSLPLAARGRVFAALHFSFPDERTFSVGDREILAELGGQCALALDRALLLDQAQAANNRLTFLSRASDLLSASLDYPSRLQELARLCVPELADWAAVDVLAENGELIRLSVTHRNPEREIVMRELQRRYPPAPDHGPSAVTVIRTGERLFVPEVTPEMIERAAVDADQVRLAAEVGIRAILCLPLTARGKTLGALTLGMAPTPDGSGRSFDSAAVGLAEELARRAAVAVENARLFQSAEVSKQRAETILESITEAFFAVDADWRFTYLNREAERTLSYRREDLMGKTLWEVFPGTVGSNFEVQYRRAVTERVTVSFQAYYPPFDIWFAVQGFPSETGLSVYFRNVNEERRREAERENLLVEQQRLVAALEIANSQQRNSLNESEERFRLLIEGVQDYAIFMLDPIGNVVTWNTGAERFSGYLAHEIVGAHFSRLYTAEDIASRHPWQELEIAAQDGRYEEEGWRVHKDGTRFWASVVITALRDETGHLRGFGKVTRDMTERHVREQESALAQAIQQQRRFLKEILASVTQGRLLLCDESTPLPDRLTPEPAGPPIGLSAKSLKAVRTRVMEVVSACGMPKDSAQDLVTAASECAMNAVVHAGGGTASVFGDTRAGRVQVRVEDVGAGINLSHLPRATLEAGFSTGGVGIGHGFSLMIACCKRVYLLTGSNGTTVVLERDRAAPEPTWLGTTM